MGSMSRRPELARAIILVGGMRDSNCPEKVRSMLSDLMGVVEALVTNYIQTTYGVAQVFYDSREVNRDEIVDRIRKPYWAMLLEDADPLREKSLSRHAGIYVA